MANSNNYHKKAGYAAQKKYAATHPEVYKKARQTRDRGLYRAHISVPLECKATLEDLASSVGLSINQLFVLAVEEKYGVVLHKQK